MTYSVSNEAGVTNSNEVSMMIAKLTPIIDANKDINTQVRITTLPGEILQIIGKSTAEIDATRKFADERVDRRIIEIPEVTLEIHPLVLNVIEQCQSEGRAATFHDFKDKIEDLTFVEELSNTVNVWINNIQQVFFIFLSIILFSLFNFINVNDFYYFFFSGD